MIRTVADDMNVALDVALRYAASRRPTRETAPLLNGICAGPVSKVHGGKRA
jgi:hypothetical protein